MKKSEFVLFISLSLILMFTLSACATLPMVAEGTTAGVSVDDITFTPIASNRCLVEIDSTFKFTGTIDGIATRHTADIIEGPCDEAAGPGIFQGNASYYGTFNEGTVNGVEGTFDIVGRWSVGPEKENYQGEIIIIKGYGDLAGLQGVLIETSENVFDTEYSGRLHFDLTQ